MNQRDATVKVIEYFRERSEGLQALDHDPLLRRALKVLEKREAGDAECGLLYVLVERARATEIHGFSVVASFDFQVVGYFETARKKDENSSCIHP